jgi:hypothetical protein
MLETRLLELQCTGFPECRTRAEKAYWASLFTQIKQQAVRPLITIKNLDLSRENNDNMGTNIVLKVKSCGSLGTKTGSQTRH